MFERNLEDNLFDLYERLKTKLYTPGCYTAFYINDPKVRLIHKASIEDRIVHHLVGKVLEEVFEPTYIPTSYSCRCNKGTLKGILNLQSGARRVGKNNTRPCFALKCDIRKFFASVNHDILFKIVSRKIRDEEFLRLIKMIIDGFSSDGKSRGLPIGNLTSQYFANIYLNEFDQFVKHRLGVVYYFRYTDDFILLSANKNYLQNLLPMIEEFLRSQLDIDLHPHKTKFLTFTRGIDFLGYVMFPHHIVPRTKTKKRVLRKINKKVEAYNQGRTSFTSLNQTIQSYLGYLSHANTYVLSEAIKNLLENARMGSEKSDGPRNQEHKNQGSEGEKLP